MVLKLECYPPLVMVAERGIGALRLSVQLNRQSYCVNVPPES